MIKFFYTTILILLITINSSAQKTDWEEMRLKGKVKKMTKTEYKAADSNGVVKKLYAGSLYTYKFNEAGFKTAEVRFDPHTKDIDETSQYFYNDSSKLKKIYSEDNTGKMRSVHQFYYDDKGNPIADTIIDEDNKVSTVYLYKYNEKSECTEMNGY